MASSKILAALDIGTSKITALVGEMDQEGKMYVIGHGVTPSEGLRRGVVVDMEKAVNSVRRAVDDAQMVSGTEIDRITVGISGEHIRSINSHGVVAVNRADNEIVRADVDKAIEAARAIAIPVDREIIHVIPQKFSVDEQTDIKDPIGMTGVRLEVEAHIVTASVTTARNLYRVLERCQLEIDHIVLEALALSNVLLTSEEADMGAVIVDIGGELTNMSVFYDGAIRHTAFIPLGGRNITNDIAIGLRTPVDKAESLKIASGAAMASMVDAEEMVEVQAAVGRDPRQISRHVLASIIEPRMEEIFSLVLREIRRLGMTETPAAGVILTGGASIMPGCTALAEQILDMPVRDGEVVGWEHIPDELTNNRFAAALGLLCYSFQNEPVKASRSSNMRGFVKKFENWISRKF